MIKIDVEGAEKHVILGAMETIRKYYPILIFETDQVPTISDTIFSILQELHYEFLEISSLNKFKEEYNKHPQGLFNVLALPKEKKLSIKPMPTSLTASKGFYYQSWSIFNTL